jgi:hypothetical protein
LAEVRDVRDELAVAERVLTRMSEQIADERAAAAPTVAQVGGHAVLLIPHRGPGVEEAALPPEYRRILAAVRQAGHDPAGPSNAPLHDAPARPPDREPLRGDQRADPAHHQGRTV